MPALETLLTAEYQSPSHTISCTPQAAGGLSSRWKAPIDSYNPHKSSKFDSDAKHKTLCTSLLRASSISVCNHITNFSSLCNTHSGLSALCLYAALWKLYHPNFFSMSPLYIPHYLPIFCLNNHTFFYRSSSFRVLRKDNSRVNASVHLETGQYNQLSIQTKKPTPLSPIKGTNILFTSTELIRLFTERTLIKHCHNPFCQDKLALLHPSPPGAALSFTVLHLVRFLKEYPTLLTVQGQPVMLGGRQGWQSSGFIFKYHRIGDDLIVEGNLQSHKPSVMS